MKGSNICKSAIIKTLSYSGVFGHPLTFHQITGNLITKYRFPPSKVKGELDKLVQKRVVKKTKKRYVLTGIKVHDVDKRIKISKDIIEMNKPTIKILSRIPWIKMIAVTGSVANQSAEKDADIDLLFVTEKNRLWISRGFVFLILKTLGKLPKDQTKREICPNIFLDERNMAWPKKKRNLYIAQNIISMQPFIWRDDVYFRFLEANKWVQNYYGNFKFYVGKTNKKLSRKKNFLMRLLESLAKKTELSYMKKGRTTEVATDKLIHFNKNDSSKKTITSYKKILKKVIYN